MTVVRIRLPELEYELLRRRARSEHRPIRDVVREAIRVHALTDTIDPFEPIFASSPIRGPPEAGIGRRNMSTGCSTHRHDLH